MELDEKTLKGHWTNQINPCIEFFIINDALFSKLCILGEDVEPCFEGSSVTAPETRFSMDTEFKNTLFSMMQDLKKVIKGGQTMESEVLKTPEVVEEPITENNVIEEPIVETENYQTKYEALVKEHTQLQNAHNELEAQFANLSQEYEKLVKFKNTIDNQKKDELINSFSSLTDEEKEDVINNKASYSLEEIEQKLSVIYTRKSINLSETNSTNVNDNPVVTFNVANGGEAMPAWIAAIKNIKNNRN